MKIISIVGARPQFIKAAMIAHAFEQLNVEHSILHSGQHYDANMSDIFFKQMSINSPLKMLNLQTADIETLRYGIERELEKEKYDFVILYGDTNTTMAGVLAAKNLRTPIAHIEAGLRSFNNEMAEEKNRIATDKHSALLFCPTNEAVKNLQNEKVSGKIFLFGDVMYDAALYYKAIAQEKSLILNELNIKANQYNLLTLHRAENTNDINTLENILSALVEISSQREIIWPIHPRTKGVIEQNPNLKALIDNSNIRVIAPLSYFDMIVMQSNANVILTDSGGIQKEAYFYHIPCITLRNETEWVETIQSGWNQLAGCTKEGILSCYAKAHAIDKHEIDQYGDGNCAIKIAQTICQNIF